jgi:hypothetical protein
MTHAFALPTTWSGPQHLRDGRSEIKMPGKRVLFDDQTWHAIHLLAKDRMMDFQELADEAFRDLLHKYARPTDLKAALRQSLKASEVAPAPGKMKRPCDKTD